MSVIVNKYNVKMPNMYTVRVYTKKGQHFCYTIPADTEQKAAKKGLAYFVTDDISCEKFSSKQLNSIQQTIDHITVERIMSQEKYVPVEVSSEIQDIHTYEVRYGERNES